MAANWMQSAWLLAQQYLFWDAYANMQRERAIEQGKDPDKAYRSAFRGMAFKYVFSQAFLSAARTGLEQRLAGAGPIAYWAGLAAFNAIVHRQYAPYAAEARHVSEVYRATSIPFMHSFEHSERTFQAMHASLQRIQGHSSILGMEASLMAARYAR